MGYTCFKIFDIFRSFMYDSFLLTSVLVMREEPASVFVLNPHFPDMLSVRVVLERQALEVAVVGQVRRDELSLRARVLIVRAEPNDRVRAELPHKLRLRRGAVCEVAQVLLWQRAKVTEIWQLHVVHGRLLEATVHVQICKNKNVYLVFLCCVC